MPKPRPLSPSEAKQTLAHRFGTRIAPRLRQLSTRFGLRSSRVFLVWVRWTGDERGEGRAQEPVRVELLPTPRIRDQTSVVYNPLAGGVLPVGTLRVDLVSVEYTSDQLEGRAVPGRPRGEAVPADWDFFYEVVEDGRGDNPPERERFRIFGKPSRDEGAMGWVLLLERTAEDLSRDGRVQVGPDEEL